MKFTRRKFIQSSTVAALAVTLGYAADGRDSGLFAVSSEKGMDSLNYLSREHFEPFINTAIRIRNENGRTATIWLREAADLKEQINVDRGYTGESYRLSFEAPRKANLAQGTYDFDHEKLGQFSLFVAPVGESGIHYEAIINRTC
jgi:hypothetical protein